MKTLPIAFAGLLVTVALAYRIEIPKALADYLEKLSSVQSLTAEYTVASPGSAPVEYTLTMAKPNLFRLSSSAGYVLSDGKNLYTYEKPDNLYTVKPLDNDTLKAFLKEPRSYVWSGFLDKSPQEDITTAKVTGTSTVAGTDTTQVDVRLRFEPTPRSLFIDEKLGVAKGLAMSVGESRYVVTVDSVRLDDKAPSADDFKWVAPSGAQEKVAFSKIRTILVSSCMPCHDIRTKSGGVTLSDYEGARKVVTPKKSKDSLMVQMLRRTDSERMPKGKDPLPENQIKLIERWIDQGAKNN